MVIVVSLADRRDGMGEMATDIGKWRMLAGLDDALARDHDIGDSDADGLHDMRGGVGGLGAGQPDRVEVDRDEISRSADYEP